MLWIQIFLFTGCLAVEPHFSNVRDDLYNVSESQTKKL